VKEAVSKCRTAVQKELKDKLSRMVVEFPVGTKFGVEKTSTNKKKMESWYLPWQTKKATPAVSRRIC